MEEEKYYYVDDDLEEDRRQWEGIHNDEAAKYRLPWEDTGPKQQGDKKMSATEKVTCCLGCLVVTAVLCAVSYGLYGYKSIELLLH